MALLLKIILGVLALIGALGIVFYIWMWWAWTPKAAPKSTYLYETVKRGVLAENFIDGGIAYEIWWEAPDLQSAKAYGVMVGRPGQKREDWRNIIYVEGQPIPQEVRITTPGFIEVIFDGPLAGGQDGVNIGVDENFYRYDYISVTDGVVAE